MTISLLSNFTRLPIMPLMIGWPTAEPKSADETPRRPSNASPIFDVAPSETCSPSSTCSGLPKSLEARSMKDAVTITSSITSSWAFTCVNMNPAESKVSNLKVDKNPLIEFP